MTVQSRDDASVLPSGEKVIAVTPFEWLLSVRSAAPELASHSLTVLSFDADASVLPSGKKATAVTPAEWPSSVCSAAPELASHSLTVLSSDADASVLPSGEKATAVTPPEWASSVCNNAFQLFSTLGNLRTHMGILSLNCILTMLVIGANIRALQYVWKGACSIADRL